MNNGEFENRDRDELGVGDLPDELAKERGEYRVTRMSDGELPPDMLRSASARADARGAGIGGPVSDYNVRGIFDSRPLNGYDFIQPVTYEVTPSPIQTVLPFLTVPAGRVIVLRAVDFSEPYDNTGQILPDTLQIADLNVKLLRNNGVVSPLYMNVVPTPAALAYPGVIAIKGPQTLDTFIIYDENETIGLYITNNGLTATTKVNIVFRGNLLLKTGVPAAFEVANKGAGKPTQVVATQDDLNVRGGGRRRVPRTLTP